MVSAIRTKLFFEDNGGFPLVLTQDFIYDSALLGRSITVPTGFATDLASIPQLLWNILPPIGKYDHAAVVHDYLYRFNGVTRAEADAVLREAMTVCGVSAHIRWLIYTGVRVGGWKPWGHYRAATTH